jgi:hypothetical protein
LSGEVSVTGGDAKEESVIVGQVVYADDGIVGLSRSMHLGEDLLRQGLGDPSGIPLVVGRKA